MKKQVEQLRGGIAHWAIHHPVGVVMITLAVMVLGLFALGRLNIDLLPHIIYPEVRVRIVDEGVPAQVMEDEVTRQLEEQLAITEDAVHVLSRTSEGRSSVDLSFEYGKDIDIALRDASTRLDRAKRFLPDSIDAPVIYKRDPFQLPVAEYVVSSSLRDPVELRSWVDYQLSKLLLNLPGVAAAEVGGGLVREIDIQVDQDRLAGLGLSVLDLADIIDTANRDVPAGRLLMQQNEISGRTAGRFTRVEDIADLPIPVTDESGRTQLLRLGEVATVLDGAEEERLRIRFNDQPGIKLSMQKQPQANTVDVVDRVEAELARLREQGQIPDDISVNQVSDQARYVRQSLHNAVAAAGSGALLAMAVVYLFLGSLRRTLIIGSAIPIAVLVTFILMAGAGLTLNIMTLGGLALGIGMLVDSTIVMLENIHRHQREGEAPIPAAAHAVGEVTGAIFASTSTNLAAVLPFLFIGGLVGLLFRELIFTISAAILASMVVALTLVPALASRTGSGREGAVRRGVDRLMQALQNGYARLLTRLLRFGWLLLILFLAGLIAAVMYFRDSKEIFLPALDEGRANVRLVADKGINVAGMNALTERIEDLLRQQPEVESLYTLVGGYIFGRTQSETPNRASIDVQLKPLAERGHLSTQAWIKRVQKIIAQQRIAGLQVRIHSPGIRGIRFNRGDDDISLRVKGPDLAELENIANQMVARMKGIDGLRNVQHSNEEITQELSIRVDRQRASSYGMTVQDIGRVVRFALEGSAITDFIEDDRSVDVRLRLLRESMTSPSDVESIVLYSRTQPRVPLRLGDIAQVRILAQPANIMRDRQQRVVEVTASLGEELTLEEAVNASLAAVADIPLRTGYLIYDAGSLETLQEGRDLGALLLGLAIFLVLVVMAVQYESLRNPLIILIGVPFASSGVALGLWITGLPLSMPVWLGLIMLAGIVVNNTIVLVEYVELERRAGMEKHRAVIEAARLRLRPILMTTLTTVVGMLPLAIGLGEGSEMLQPLAVTIVAGLSFSTLVTLVLMPVLYELLGRPEQTIATGQVAT